jgi:hypothetical protein
MLRAAILTAAFVAAPALASSHYHAQPAAKPAAAKLVVRDTIWSCGDGGCQAATKSSSRPAIVCEILVKQVGALRSFTVAGEALTAEQLEKCNARAN